MGVPFQKRAQAIALGRLHSLDFSPAFGIILSIKSISKVSTETSNRLTLQRVAGRCEAMGKAMKSTPSSWAGSQDDCFRRDQSHPSSNLVVREPGSPVSARLSSPGPLYRVGRAMNAGGTTSAPLVLLERGVYDSGKCCMVSLGRR